MNGCESSCDKNNFVSRDVGTFVSVAPISTFWNKAVKSIVITTKGTFTIKGYASGVKGDKVWVGTKKSTGQRFLLIEHQRYGKPLY